MGYHDECNDVYGRLYQVGCRDASVVLWEDAQWAKDIGSGGSGWASSPSAAGRTGNDPPDRVRVARLANFRIYCSHDGNTLCTQPPPQDLVGSRTNSSVWGRFVGSQAITIGGDLSQFNRGASIYGNKVGLES